MSNSSYPAEVEWLPRQPHESQDSCRNADAQSVTSAQSSGPEPTRAAAPSASSPDGLPHRQSRARADLEGSKLPARSTSGPRSPGIKPISSPAGAVDLDRLRASAASAIDAEQLRSEVLQKGADRTSPPAWAKIAVPIGVVAALVGIGIALIGSDGTATGDTATERSAGTTATPPVATETEDGAPESTVAPAADPAETAAQPAPAATSVTEPVPETTATVPTAAPAAPAAGVADAGEAPRHKAVYRDGKLYLEGSITSTEQAQKYVEKAAAVLGADNVVNNYVVDPNVPLSSDGTVYVDEPFLFETGSAQLNPTYTGILGLGIAALRLNPNARMVVTGYTDNVGDPAKNQTLSEARARTVVDYMVTTGGIARERLDAIGAGDRDPVGDNNTEAGRKLNRRIDVKLVNLLG